MLLESFKVCLALAEEWFYILWPKLAFYVFKPILDDSEGFGRFQNIFIENYYIERMFLDSFKVCFASPEKWFCIC